MKSVKKRRARTLKQYPRSLHVNLSTQDRLVMLATAIVERIIEEQNLELKHE